MSPRQHGIRIHNVMTNIVGRTKTERIVTGEVWKKEIQPALNILLKDKGIKSHRAQIGKWIVEYTGNDAHMHEFFVRNWKPAGAGPEPHVKSLVFTGVRDRKLMMQLLGFRSEEDVRRHLQSFLDEIKKNTKYRASLRDEKLRNIESYPEKEQVEIALFAPATVYSSEQRTFVSLNTNYYGQLKSKSSLGPLEEFLITKARMEGGRIANPEAVWISMHAGCVEYAEESGRKRGIVLIAPTGTGKSTQGYGLVEAKTANRLHSDDWVFVNAGTREVATSENHFYMRTNIAGIYPHLIPLLVDQPLENVPFTPDIIKLLEGFDSPQDIAAGLKDGRINEEQHQKIIDQMVENNSARSLIDTRLMVGSKFVESTQLTDIFLMKRDYDTTMILKVLNEEEMAEVMTSSGNVYNYAYGKSDADGYGIPEKRTTEIYYNPYLCICEVDREKNLIGPLDQIRIEAYRTLVRHGGVAVAWINSRLAPNQSQFCIRRYLEGGIDEIQIAKGAKAGDALLRSLGLERRAKPAAEGRRPEDLTGFYDRSGREVEIVCFYRKQDLIEAAAFIKSGKAPKQLAGYSGGTVEDFLKKYAPLGASQLLGFE